MTDKEIIIVSGRQAGLERQMQIPGVELRVYDKRFTKPLENLRKGIENYADVWFAEDSRELPLVDENMGIISGYFEGAFSYTCQGSRESDPQYVVLKTLYQDAEKFAEALQIKGGKNILIGREVKKLETLQLASDTRTALLEGELQMIMSLPRESQERVLRQLMLYRQEKELK